MPLRLRLARAPWPADRHGVAVAGNSSPRLRVLGSPPSLGLGSAEPLRHPTSSSRLPREGGTALSKQRARSPPPEAHAGQLRRVRPSRHTLHLRRLGCVGADDAAKSGGAKALVRMSWRPREVLSWRRREAQTRAPMAPSRQCEGLLCSPRFALFEWPLPSARHAHAPLVPVTALQRRFPQVRAARILRFAQGGFRS